MEPADAPSHTSDVCAQAAARRSQAKGEESQETPTCPHLDLGPAWRTVRPQRGARAPSSPRSRPGRRAPRGPGAASARGVIDFRLLLPTSSISLVTGVSPLRRGRGGCSWIPPRLGIPSLLSFLGLCLPTFFFFWPHFLLLGRAVIFVWIWMLDTVFLLFFSLHPTPFVHLVQTCPGRQLPCLWFAVSFGGLFLTSVRAHLDRPWLQGSSSRLQQRTLGGDSSHGPSAG